MSEYVNEIPVIDVKGLTEKEEDLQQLAAKIKDAFTDVGFVAITNHNISLDLINKAWENVDKFFSLPDTVKSKSREDTSKKILGWSPLGAQTLYNAEAEEPSAADFREALDIDNNNFNWPSEIPGFKETTMPIIEEMSILGIYILKLIAVALDLKRDYFLPTHNMLSDKNISSLRFAQYPPIPKGGLVKGQMRCGEHTDWGSITLLIQDEYGGLEVQRRDGTWITSHPPLGSVMVNIADLMQRWTSDKFISTNHRVREPEDESLKCKTRRSLVYFINPDDDTIVSCIDESGKYPSTNSSDYLWQLWRQHLN